MWLRLYLVISLGTPFCSAADSAVVSFYRSQQSLFPSGQARRESLEKKILRRDREPWFRVQWNNKEFEIPGDTLIVDAQLTQTLVPKKSLSLWQLPQENAPRAGRVEAKKALLVLQTKNGWAQVKSSEKGFIGWAPLEEFDTPFEDTGIFVTLMDSFLRKKPDSTSEILTTVPRLWRVQPLAFEKDHIRISYQGHSGYLDLANLAGRGDFAMWAYHKDKGWLGISHRENAHLYTVNKQKFPLTEFLAFNPYKDRGVVSQKLSDEGPSIRSRVSITHARAHRWALSQLEGHGAVWWRMEEGEDLQAPPASPTQITTEQLMKRELTSVAFAGKSMKGLASANGVFRTEDSKVWTEIPQFAGKDYPVAIHPDGIWYVGNYKSHDEGRTFENYIKWDKLAQQIQTGLHFPARHLRISQIEPLTHSRIRILIDTGVQKVKMQAHVLSTDWQFVK